MFKRAQDEATRRLAIGAGALVGTLGTFSITVSIFRILGHIA